MKPITLMLFAGVLIIVGVLIFMYMTSPPKSNPLVKENAEAVQIAKDELLRRNVPIDAHEVDVVKRENSMVIIFTPPGREPGQRGSNSGQRGYEVEVTENLEPVSITAIR